MLESASRERKACKQSTLRIMQLDRSVPSLPMNPAG